MVFQPCDTPIDSYVSLYPLNCRQEADDVSGTATLYAPDGCEQTLSLQITSFFLIDISPSVAKRDNLVGYSYHHRALCVPVDFLSYKKVVNDLVRVVRSHGSSVTLNNLTRHVPPFTQELFLDDKLRK